MVKFVPRKIIGKWRDGYALDLHTLGSTFMGYDEFGHARFDTQRSEMGELLYRLKYHADQEAVLEMASAASEFLGKWDPQPDVLVPVPPSNQRKVQPVLVLAEAIAGNTGIPLLNSVKRTRSVPQLKNVFDLDERARLLEGLHTVDSADLSGKRVLLFDDLFRSGATLNAVASEITEQGHAMAVFALTITRTRSNQ